MMKFSLCSTRTGRVTAGLSFAAALWLMPTGDAAALPATPARPAPSDSVTTEKQFFLALQQADAEAFRSRFEPYFLLILSPQQKQAYERYTGIDERKAYMQYYWKAANPNPLLAENDWLIEFSRRIRYAKKHFPAAAAPYIDDRGRYYIRYGVPQRRFEDAGGMSKASFFAKPIVQQHFRLSAPLSYSLPANETWSYENVNGDFVVIFMKQGISYRTIRSLEELVIEGKRANQFAAQGITRQPNWEYWIWGDLVKRRAAVSPTLARTANKIRDLEMTIELIAKDPRKYAYMFGEELTSPQSILFSRSQEMEAEIAMAASTAPPAAHDPVHAKNRLDFFDRISQFRGQNGQTRLEIALAAPFKKNLVKKFKKSSRQTLELEFSGMIRDAQFDPVVKSDATLSYPVAAAAKEKLRNALGSLTLSTRPQQAELTLQFRDRRSDKIGFYRQPLAIRDFSGQKLMLSDAQLLIEIGNNAMKKLWPWRERRGVAVAPYPFAKIRKSRPPLLYFEIYNLRAAGITETLQIDYKITSMERRDRPSVSVSYTSPVAGDMAEELIALDLKNAKKGRHLLEITVSSPQQTGAAAAAQAVLHIDN